MLQKWTWTWHPQVIYGWMHVGGTHTKHETHLDAPSSVFIYLFHSYTHQPPRIFSCFAKKKLSSLCHYFTVSFKKDAPRILDEASSRRRPASRLRSTKREETDFHLTPPSPPYLLGWGEVQPTASVKSYKWFPGPKCHLLQTPRYKDAEALWYESALNSSHLPSDHHLRSNAGWGRHTLNVRYTDTHSRSFVSDHFLLLCVSVFFSFVPRQSAEHLFGRNNNIWLQQFHNGRESRAPSPVWHQGKTIPQPLKYQMCN